jgi:undecaprenyl-diphosphatase
MARANLGRVVAVSIAVLAISSVLVSDQRYLRGEVALFEAVNGWPRWIGAPLEVVNHLGTLGAAIVVVAVVAVATVPLGPRPTLAVALTALLAWRLDDVLKELIERPRPDVVLDDAIVRDTTATGFGYPSGHCTIAFALTAVLLALFAPRLPMWARWLLWVPAIGVALARMYLGVHWPMDTLGGAALGIAIGGVSWLVLAPTHHPLDASGVRDSAA